MRESVALSVFRAILLLLTLSDTTLAFFASSFHANFLTQGPSSTLRVEGPSSTRGKCSLRPPLIPVRMETGAGEAGEAGGWDGDGRLGGDVTEARRRLERVWESATSRHSRKIPSWRWNRLLLSPHSILADKRTVHLSGLERLRPHQVFPSDGTLSPGHPDEMGGKRFRPIFVGNGEGREEVGVLPSLPVWRDGPVLLPGSHHVLRCVGSKKLSERQFD